MGKKDKESFKNKHPFDKRKSEATRIKKQYSDRIPVIVEQGTESKLPPLDKKKYLVPGDITVGQFIFVIRKRIRLRPEEAIFMFVNNCLPATASLMSKLYHEHKDEDGFLYITISGESTFGNFNQNLIKP